MNGHQPWHKGIVVAFDLETTGIDVETARIVTASVLRIEPPAHIHELNWLLDPGIPIPDTAAAIHGITTDKAKAEGTDPAVALLEIVNALRQAWIAGWPVIGHNLGTYDLNLLDRELRRYGLGTLTSHGGPGMVVDTLALDRLIRPHWRGKRTLTDCAQAYDVRQGEAHQAQGDAVTSARIAYRMAEAFPDVLQRDLHELMDMQQHAHYAWASEFGSYLRSVGKHDDVTREWPYREPAPQEAA